MGKSDEGENREAFVILQEELTRLRDATQAAWRDFHAWFMWSLGAQPFILGWIVAKKEEVPKDTRMIVLAGAIVILNLLGVTAAVKIRSFIALQIKRANAICRSMMERAEASGLAINITSGSPSDFARLAAGMYACALLTVAMVWLYLLCYSVGHLN